MNEPGMAGWRDWFRPKPRVIVKPRRRFPMYGGANLGPEWEDILHGYDDGLMGKRGFFRKVEKRLRKPLAFVAGSSTAFLPGGGTTRKLLRIKGSSVKAFKRGRTVGRIVGGAALAIVAGPAILSAIGSGGPLSIGAGLKFLGGKVLAMGPKAMAFLRSQGKDPLTATVDEVLGASLATGEVSQAELHAAQRRAIVSGGGGAAPSAEEAETEPSEAPVTGAAMAPGMKLTPGMILVGAGVLALAALSGRGRSRT